MQRVRRSHSPFIEVLVIAVISLVIVAGVTYWTSDRDPTNGLPSNASGPIVNSTSATGTGASTTLVEGVDLTGEWPSMKLVYTVDGTVTRLEYQDQRHWSKDVVESTANPDLVGMVMIYDGTIYTEYEPQTVGPDGQPLVRTEELTDGYVAPERWLRPSFTANLVSEGYRVEATEDPQQIAFEATAYVPCPPPSTATGQEPALPTSMEECRTGDTYTEFHRYVVSTEVTPPILVDMEITAGGESINSVQVTEIDLTPGEVDLSLPVVQPTTTTSP